jgi:hypothetical protein|tara:strand:- start:153 stop:347 length:195 start_codon:yes stop_codon:yes gene_type:complete
MTQYHHWKRIEGRDDITLLALKLLIHLSGASGLVVWVYAEPMLGMPFQDYVDQVRAMAINLTLE